MTRKILVLAAIKLFKKRESPFFSIGNCYYYKRICVDLTKGSENVYDTSTDLWRPLNHEELGIIVVEGFEKCNLYVTIKNTKEELKNNRKDFHIATIKNNAKDKYKFFNKSMNALKKLRVLLGY